MLGFCTVLQGQVETWNMRISIGLGASSRQENLGKTFWSTKVNRAVIFHQPVEFGCILDFRHFRDNISKTAEILTSFRWMHRSFISGALLGVREVQNTKNWFVDIRCLLNREKTKFTHPSFPLFVEVMLKIFTLEEKKIGIKYSLLNNQILYDKSGLENRYVLKTH